MYQAILAQAILAQVVCVSTKQFHCVLMERSRLVSPSSQLSELERHDDVTAISPIKLSRPQKRRRRADRQAVRDALVNTSSLKSALSAQNIIVNDTDESINPVSNTQMQLSVLESKVDQLLLLVSTLWCTSSADDGGVASSDQSVSTQMADVLRYLNPAAPEFIPSNSSEFPTCEESGTTTNVRSQGEVTHRQGSPSSQQSRNQDISEQMEFLAARVSRVEGEVEELLGQEASSNTEEVHASIRGVEQHFELELTRARAQSDYDFSRCMKSLQSLESTVQQSLKEPAAAGSNVVGARAP